MFLEIGIEELKARAIRGGFARLCGQGANFVLRLGSMAVLARLLDPEDFGLVAMAAVIRSALGAASAAPNSAASSGSHPKAPGSAGGYLRVPSMNDSLEVEVLYPA